MLGPFNLRAGESVEWNSHQAEEYVDTLALSDKPHKEKSSGYDIIIVMRTLLPKGVMRSDKSMVFLASMCRLKNPAAVHTPDVSSADKDSSQRSFPLTCVVQKTQSKTGVFLLEEIYGLEATTQKKTAAKTNDNNSDDGSTSGDCVICLSDPRYDLFLIFDIPHCLLNAF